MQKPQAWLQSSQKRDQEDNHLSDAAWTCEPALSLSGEDEHPQIAPWGPTGFYGIDTEQPRNEPPLMSALMDERPWKSSLLSLQENKLEILDPSKNGGSRVNCRLETWRHRWVENGSQDNSPGGKTKNFKIVKAEHWVQAHRGSQLCPMLSKHFRLLVLLELVTAAATAVEVLLLRVVVLVLGGLPLPAVTDSVSESTTTTTSKVEPHLREKSEDAPTILVLPLPLWTIGKQPIF